ncbi:MAG: hypothetical protein CL670_06390 [Balneola sp.]|jgi:hypothetical protein|nr:hypothetical protein [Balneola sp.]MBE78766.1 hypothetical protein [Balneola sp.]HBX65222.1 hypothetical protein [Balneolaceae bacterium]|tara:strand:- start:134 stop:904 length:771 start_codon:yes stop_codon:yes gene_type:complete
MSRLEKSFEFFSRQGIKFLLLELVIVFLGVYGAFLLQNSNEDRRIDAEKQKILTGVKEELEYFRIFFPGFAGNDAVAERNVLIQQDEYDDFSNWRFIQPQYNYTAIEYSLGAPAEIIDYDLNADLSTIYREIRKLEHAEELMTTLSMEYKAIPDGLENNAAVQFADENNLLNFVRFNSRADDRARIMNRLADLSAEILPNINSQFPPEYLKDIELSLISENISASSEAELEATIPAVQNFFPNLSEEEIRQAIPIE